MLNFWKSKISECEGSANKVFISFIGLGKCLQFPWYLIVRNKILVSNDLPNNTEIDKAMADIGRLTESEMNKVKHSFIQNLFILHLNLSQWTKEFRRDSCIQARFSHS